MDLVNLLDLQMLQNQSDDDDDDMENGDTHNGSLDLDETQLKGEWSTSACGAQPLWLVCCQSVKLSVNEWSVLVVYFKKESVIAFYSSLFGPKCCNP